MINLRITRGVIVLHRALVYPRGMNALLNVHPGQWYLLVAPHSHGRKLMNALAARLALRGPVQILDGGNQFDGYSIARFLQRQGRGESACSSLQRLTIARAFTCYQMVSLLTQQEATTAPVLILDLLATFCDESAPATERLRLLDQSLEQLQRLCAQASIVVSVSPLPAGQPAELLTRLENRAGHCLYIETPAEPTQARLL